MVYTSDNCHCLGYHPKCRKIIQKDKKSLGRNVDLNNSIKQILVVLNIFATFFSAWKQNPKHDILTKGAETLCG